MEYNTNDATDFKKRIVSLSENDMELLDHVDIFWQENIHFDVYASLLCINGKAECKMGNKVIEIKKWDVFLGHPNLFVENAMASIDFEYRIFLMSPALFESIFLLENNIWDIKFLLEENPVIHLNEEQSNRLLQNYDFLKSKLSLPKTEHHKEIINLLLQSIIYEFFDCIKPQLQLIPYSYSSGESIFKRFMALVSENTPLHRDVKFYADKLCITSKYLSAICKENTGKPASEIIGNHAVNRIKRMLCASDKSVKEVANEAGFDNLSFFGKYVRRELGVSPREYRIKQTY